MSSNGNIRRSPRTSGKGEQDDEQFQLRKVFLAFTELPRVIRLVWSTSPLLTVIMALLSLVSGFLPAVSVWITRGVVDSVILAAFTPTHNLGPVWFFVILQLLIGL